MESKTKKQVIVIVLALAALLYGVFLYIQKTQDMYLASLTNVLQEQQATLVTLSELTNRNAVDSYSAGIINDCPAGERVRFDDLLGTLNTLEKPELVEVNQLFSGCASYDAEQKALMTSRLKREVEIYSQYVSLLENIGSQNVTEYQVKRWNEIVDFEIQRTELSQKLVTIQREIIQILLDGKTITSPEMRTLLEQAQESKDTLSYIRTKIDVLQKQVQ